jgi:glycosyltransferase involved in cell wall biosynthesis
MIVPRPVVPSVSIVIPCWNAEATIANAIDSALAQTHPRCEVIVVDDGSTDGSAAIIAGYGTRIVALHGPNRGGNAARNRGIEVASGEWIQFLDADDVLELDCIAAKLAFVDETGMLPVADTRVIEHDGSMRIRHWVRVDDDAVCAMINRCPWTAAVLLPVADLRAIGGLDESLRACQEYDLAIRLAIGTDTPSRFARLPKVLATYRRRFGSVSSDGERISRAFVQVFWGVLASLESRQALTPKRRSLLAIALAQSARSRFRYGDLVEAKRLFGRSAELDPGAVYAAFPHTIQRILLRLFGPMRTERLACAIRSLSDRRSSQSHASV